MSVFDLVIFAILIALAFRGWMTGMVSQIVSVGSFVVSWVVASRFAFLIAPSIPAEEPWNKIGAMIVLFVMTLVAVRFTHSYLEKKIKDWHLAKWNRYLGGILGFVKGLLLCMVLTFFGVMLSEATREIVFKSKSGNHLAQLIAKTGTFIPSDSCELLHQQLELFNAKMSGLEISTDISPEEKLFQKMSALIPSGLETQEKTENNLDNLISQGSLLLEQARNLKQGTGAASLLDAIGKWWTGSGKTEKAEKTQDTATDKVANAAVTLLPEPVLPEPLLPKPVLPEPLLPEPVLPKSTLPKSVLREPVLPRSHLPEPLKAVDNAALDKLPERPVRVFHPQGATDFNFSAETGEKSLAMLPLSGSEEKMLFRRRSSETVLPETNGAMAEQLATALPLDSESLDFAARPMSIPRSSASFRLRSSPIYSSDRLLQSSPTRVPATLFVPPKH
ncbi:MAG: CvpA family protein [Planctomycetaceae bacterium]|jgi:uncharacterized membrane protein required for colicin V production|nr:CvpA family protein [Planctomycetaceae bacterium]